MRERINSNIWASQSWSVVYMYISDILCCTLAVSLHGRNLLTWATFLVEFNYRVVPSFLFPKNLRCVYWLFLKLIWGSTLKTETPPPKKKKKNIHFWTHPSRARGHSSTLHVSYAHQVERDAGNFLIYTREKKPMIYTYSLWFWVWDLWQDTY